MERKSKMTSKSNKEHKHNWIDGGLGYFVGTDDSQMFFHDPDAMASNLHDWVCPCGEHKYQSTEPES